MIDNSNIKSRKSGRVISILSKLLVFSKWALLFQVATAILSAVGAPFFPLQFGGDPATGEGRTVQIGVVFDEDMTRAAVYLETLIIVVVCAAGLYAVHHFRRIISNAASGRAFARENGVRLRKIGYVAAGAQVSVYVLWVFSAFIELAGLAVFDGRTMAITPAPWLIILGVFALSTIFLEGADIKEEQDLTV